MDPSAPKMEASAVAVDAPRAERGRERPAPTGATDPFRLGFRWRRTVTPDGRDKDLEKNKSRYAKEGVEEYFTVYPVVGRRVRDLVGRRLEKGGYVEISPDAQGRVYSRKLGLFFQIDAASQKLVVVDAGTGERLLTSDEEEAGRRREAEARRQAEVRAELETAARRQAEARGVEDLCAVLGPGWEFPPRQGKRSPRERGTFRRPADQEPRLDRRLPRQLPKPLAQRRSQPPHEIDRG